MKSKLLIICYFYPPYPGIGGRRTAKFARTLAALGHEIHVIGAKNPFHKESVWTEESRHPNIHYHPIDPHYPKALLTPDDRDLRSDSLWTRIQFRLYSMWFKAVQPLRVYDPTLRMEKPLRKKVKQIIEKEDIENVWVSVSPYYYTWYMARLKKEEYPEMNLIIDFRDPWLQMESFGIGAMNEEEWKKEKEVIQETLDYTNTVTAPSSFVLAEFEPFLNDKTRSVEILHPYDPEDIKEQTQGVSYSKGEKINFVYGGTLYPELEPALKLLKSALDVLKKEKQSMYERLNFAFYSHEREFTSLFSSHEQVVKFFDPIGKSIIKKVFEADYVMMLYAHYNQNFRTTKFHAYMPSERPYFYLGPRGDNYRFIEENKIGLAFDENKDLEKLLRFFEDIDSHLDSFKQGLDFRDFSLENQTKKFIELLK